MQIEDNIDIKNPCIYSNIKTMFNIAGIEIPQIVFWNLKVHNGFPVSTIYNYEDILMISGFSEKVLSIFNSKNKKDNKDKKKKHRTHNIFFDIINNKRYDFVNKEVLKIILL